MHELKKSSRNKSNEVWQNFVCKKCRKVSTHRQTTADKEIQKPIRIRVGNSTKIISFIQLKLYENDDGTTTAKLYSKRKIAN